MTPNGSGPVKTHKGRAAVWRGWGRGRKGPRGSHALVQKHRAALPRAGRAPGVVLVGPRTALSPGLQPAEHGLRGRR